MQEDAEQKEEEKEMEPEVNIAYTPSVPASDFTLRLFMHLTIETFVQHVWHICAATQTHTCRHPFVCVCVCACV